MSEEYTLDFLEATQALDEGKCERIKSVHASANNEYDIEYCNRHEALVLYRREGFVDLGIQAILGKWKLVGVKPRTEQRTVKYWLVVYDNGQTSLWDIKPPKDIYNRAQQIIPLSHKYTYTFPAETLNPVMGKVLKDFEKGNHG